MLNRNVNEDAGFCKTKHLCRTVNKRTAPPNKACQLSVVQNGTNSPALSIFPFHEKKEIKSKIIDADVVGA
jgi:hypothetical protein